MVLHQIELNLPEKQHFLQVLGSDSNSGIHSHAYIVEGASGIGKTDFAIFCASAILCIGKNNDRPCRACNACKKIFTNSHPDLHFYGVEGEKPITMKEVRELIASSVLLPNDGDKKIYIIRAAHKMRPDTQNAILKIFEEPPASVVLFLLTEKKEALLPTILSRGRLITLHGEGDEQIKAQLVKKYKLASSAEIQAAVNAANGSIGQAEQFLNKENRDARQKATDLLNTLFEGRKADFCEKLISVKIAREKLLDLLELLQRMFSDILEYKYKSRSLVLLSEEEADRYGSSITKKAVTLMCGAVSDCRNSIEQSGNINAAVTNLCIKLWMLKG